MGGGGGVCSGAGVRGGGLIRLLVHKSHQMTVGQ